MSKNSIINGCVLFLVGGAVIGGIVAKSIYRKGKLTAYHECVEAFNTLQEDMDNMVTEQEEIEEKA